MSANVKQTICKYCDLDIENFSPYRNGEWRDRGNNTHCRKRDGELSRILHAPVRFGRKLSEGERPSWS